VKVRTALVGGIGGHYGLFRGPLAATLRHAAQRGSWGGRGGFLAVDGDLHGREVLIAPAVPAGDDDVLPALPVFVRHRGRVVAINKDRLAHRILPLGRPGVCGRA
jgi:hypothetical protein